MAITPGGVNPCVSLKPSLACPSVLAIIPLCLAQLKMPSSSFLSAT
jgi:hypothetical protein